ncbi:hypothetical protein AADZ91_03250 [Colwelliaceae bacterium 6441]
MKIKDAIFQQEEKTRTKIELVNLLKQPSDKQERPCPGCRLTFPDDPSITSTAHCSIDCAEAGRKMSSDPNKFPIEEHVVPIVYAIYTLRLLMPCWSCEGHENDNDELIKVPKIWFYSVSPFYAKLIAQSLSTIKYKNKLHFEWSIKVLPFSQSMFTLTYSMEPEISTKETFVLKNLHHDMRVIGENLRENVLHEAKKYLDSADNSPFTTK